MQWEERQKKQEAMIDRLHEAAESEKEVCVICGALTDVPKTRGLEFRKYYIEGVGQLCRMCAEEYRS